MTKSELVPPDGGYGWVVVSASALSNFITYPLVQCFGLIFKDTFAELGFSAAQGSLIININSSFQMLVGLANGPLLNAYGYRKMSLLGGLFIAIGVMLTSLAGTFLHFVITYGIITAFGMGLTLSSFSLAVNSYFREKRARAIAICMTLTGLGPIFVPQLIRFLLINYTVQDVTLILGAISGHSIIGASLLQPLKWHLKKKVVDQEKLLTEELKEAENEPEKIANGSERPPFERSVSRDTRSIRRDSKDSQLTLDQDLDNPFVYGIDSHLGGSTLSLTEYQHRRRSCNSSTQNRDINNSTNMRTKTEWWKSASSVNLESSEDIFEEKEQKVYNNDLTVPKERKPLWKRFFNRLAIIFDLNLLKDPIYVNIMLGMSLAVFAELNFSVLTPFILADMNLDTSQISVFMSIVAIADIIFRFLAPDIGKFVGLPARTMYAFTLLGLIVTRFCLLLTNDYYYLLAVALILGIAKGVRTVYMSLVIPTYVPIDRLASASGIQMMVNGVIMMIGGPIIGIVRDMSGNYNIGIAIMNCVTFSTVLMWTGEYLIRRYKYPKTLNAPIDT